MENLHLIAGLGNPGREYAATRHNAGFRLVEHLAGRWKASWVLEKKFQCKLARAQWQERTIWLCEPQTFMNASGEAVGPVAAFYRVKPAHILVVVDDADLALGEIRLRPKGSSGGHHGLDSVEQHLGTRDYARLRIGIGRKADGVREITGHVLGRFDAAEEQVFETVLKRAGDAAECWLTSGIEKAMNQFNGTAVRSATDKGNE
ncbi:MAG: aminoacyl-tRNA hydrolase [Verrucomicrobiota bacterium]